MKLSDIIPKYAIISPMRSTRKEDVIKELVRKAKKVYKLDGLNVNEAVKKIFKREKEGSTGVGDGIAIPHAKFNNIDNAYAVFGKTKRGIKFNAIDGQPVNMFFLVLCPENNPTVHLETLQTIVKVLNKPNFKKFLADTKTPEEIQDLFVEFSEKQQDEVSKTSKGA